MMVKTKILVAFFLNLFFSIFELIGGLFTNSISIISDSVHDLGDSLSTFISYVLERKSEKGPDSKYTYGYVRYSLLGAVITTVILIVGSVFVIVGSVFRVINPVVVNYDGMIIFAIIGVVVNFVAHYLTSKGEGLNQKAVSLHMLEDTLGWVVVLVGAFVIKVTNFYVIDPIMSIGVALFIFISAFKNLMSVVTLFLERVPSDKDLDKIIKSVKEVKGVVDVHHIHLWNIDEVNSIITMHIVSSLKDFVRIKCEVRKILDDYEIEHATIEMEEENENCESYECKIEHHKKGHNH